MAMRIALTVDLEPDWGLRGTQAFREVTPRFLRFLEDRGMRATFFVVSDLMDTSADMVAELGKRNEIGSHGRDHGTMKGMSERAMRATLTESRQRLSLTGHPVQGFRAPFFRADADLHRLVEECGYRYDASMGTVMPGLHNRRLAALACPTRIDGLYEFPTSAMAWGMLPLSLTWLRVFWPWSAGRLPRSASLIYLHLHEFLPPETAIGLPWPLRSVLTRNCGEAAWDVLDRALGQLNAECTTCASILNDSRAVSETGIGGKAYDGRK